MLYCKDIEPIIFLIALWRLICLNMKCDLSESALTDTAFHGPSLGGSSATCCYCCPLPAWS